MGFPDRSARPKLPYSRHHYHRQPLCRENLSIGLFLYYQLLCSGRSIQQLQPISAGGREDGILELGLWADRFRQSLGCYSHLKKSNHGVTHRASTEGAVKSLTHESFDCGSLDGQIMAQPIEALDFAPDHQFANFPLDSLRQPVEDQLFVDASDQFAA
jgi:hypothetical protein